MEHAVCFDKNTAIQDLREVQAFAAIVHYGSLIATARALNLPKSTLSRRISQLEKRLGQALLRRQSNRLIPTEAGYVFADYCHQILRLVSQTQTSLSELQTDVSGELLFAFHNAFTRGWLGDVMEAFMQQYPEVRVQMRTCMTPPAVSEVEEVSLWLGEVPDSSLRHEKLGTLTQGIYASPDYVKQHGVPAHPRELLQHEWIDTLAQTPAGVELNHPDEGQYLLPPSPSLIRVDQLVLQGDAIVRGKGVGFFPNWLAELRLKAHPGTMQRVLPAWTGPNLDVWLCYPYGQLSPRSQALIRHLRDATPEAITDGWRFSPDVPSAIPAATRA